VATKPAATTASTKMLKSGVACASSTMVLAGAATWSSLPQAVSKVVAAATPVKISRFLRSMGRLLESKVRFQIGKQNSFESINFLGQLNTN
jgi:hypothetical protein